MTKCTQSLELGPGQHVMNNVVIDVNGKLKRPLLLRFERERIRRLSSRW